MVVQPFWRRRLLPSFLVLLGLNALGLAVWTVPRTIRLRNAAVRAEAARAEVARQREATARLRDRADAIRSNGVDIERFYGQVVGPAQSDLLPTLEAIEDMARSPGLKVGRRAITREEVKDTPLERVAILLPLEGSYAQLVGFVREVERSRRFLTVDRIAMRGQGEGSASLQVEISTYLRVAPGGSAGRSGRGR
jgi:Tfp pilus assembly protein PilO